jgi:hypothetical protein
MTALFDILKKERDGTLVWVEAANDIQTGRSRLEQLSAAESSCEFVVLRQIDLRIIVTSRQKTATVTEGHELQKLCHRERRQGCRPKVPL